MGNGQSQTCSGCGCKSSEEPDAPGDEPIPQIQDDVTDQLSMDSGEPWKGEVDPWALAEDTNLTVMMFGMTGAGKSALGNLMAGCNAFESGDDTASMTNLDSVMKYQAPDNSIHILDTIGLGDTEIDQEKVVSSIRDVALSAPNGVDCLLFVMRNARITDDAIARLIYVTEFLWGQECLLNLYIVVTFASRYLASKDDAIAWIDRQVEINWRFKHIFGLVGNNPNRFIFVDNPAPDSGEPNQKERQDASRRAIMQTLALHPRDVIPPFTHAMMKKAQDMIGEEKKNLKDKEEQVRELQTQLPKKKKKKAAAKAKPEAAEKPSKLEEDLSKAKEEKAAAAKAMQEALDRVKADKHFQEQAAKEAELATIKFTQRFEQAAEEAAAKGEAAAKEGPAQACRRMAVALGKKTGKRLSMVLGGRKSSKDKPDQLVASEVQQETKLIKGPVEPAVGGVELEVMYDQIIARVRKTFVGSLEEQFNKLELMFGDPGQTGRPRKLTDEDHGTISPMGFRSFMKTSDPTIDHHQIGGLWRRADANCDGQLDFHEFCALFSDAPVTADARKHLYLSGNGGVASGKKDRKG